MSLSVSREIPITVFSGYLGAGKTTIILSLLPKLPKNYKIVLLKNEFGDVKVDSELAKESNVEVTEMLNGCLCCVLVGQMKSALQEIKEKLNPDRILVETSGSAFPGPIAWQIREMKDEGFLLDGIVTVIDCVNFTGYEDVSYTAKLQAQYTDVILMNKWELISERAFDLVLDHVYTLNENTPKIKFSVKDGIIPDVIFGLDSKLFLLEERKEAKHAELNKHHHSREVDIIQIVKTIDSSVTQFSIGPWILTTSDLDVFLTSIPQEPKEIYRVKGLVRLTPSDLSSPSILYILNYAFGRYALTPVKSTSTLESNRELGLKLTVMGQDLGMWTKKFVHGFKVDSTDLTFYSAERD